jgi:hypothetical protein
MCVYHMAVGDNANSVSQSTIPTGRHKAPIPFQSTTYHKKNSIAGVRERTIPTEQLTLDSEVSANVLRIEGAIWSV